MLKSELAEPANAKLREKLAAIQAARPAAEVHVIASPPLRDARGAVVQFTTVSLGVPGAAAWQPPETLAPMPHLTRKNCIPNGPMRFATPVSIVKDVTPGSGPTSPIDARIRVLEARLAALEHTGGGVGPSDATKPVQPAPEPRSEAAVETVEYARYREAKAVEARHVPTQYSYPSYGR